jgi:hypothetical protein
MKSLFVLALMLSTAGFCNEAEAEYEYPTGKTIEDKYYPNPQSVHVEQNGIYVDFEESQYRVDGLLSDSRGIYVVKAPVNEWRCSKGHPKSTLGKSLFNLSRVRLRAKCL